ncbi:TPA: winged helix-turn-helix domain-containing protein [Candidatus Poribacteria bacterium]|nr:winged helix-turn-helix domain-containing protein [Candidatus Poribacteria bacterium]
MTKFKPKLPKLSLSLETARTLAVIKQGLHQRPLISDKRTLLNSIRRIGLLQLDTINVVARSHYLVMLSRVGPYNPNHLDALLYPDRCIFEQWCHARCLIPVGDYTYFAPVILARRDCPLRDGKLKALGEDPQGTLDAVLAQVSERGPLASRDFEDTRNKRGSWWNRKPARVGLEVLFRQGYLMVDRRVNFQCYYDLAERVLPASSDAPSKTVENWQRWATLRGVTCLGVATAEHVSDYYRQRKPAAQAMLEALAAEGAVVPVDVEGWKETAYLSTADLPLVEAIETGAHQPKLTTFLSPFDNLTWNRRRLRDLFGFDYRIEMYTPAPKRRYGYYVMPILHRGQLVGRLDPKADRQTGTMIVRSIYLEPGKTLTGDLLAGVARALHEFMVFHNNRTLIIERSEPEELKTALMGRLTNR